MLVPDLNVPSPFIPRISNAASLARFSDSCNVDKRL